MGAEEVALLTATEAGGPEIREQPRRESSAVRGSGTGQEKPNGQFLLINITRYF